MKIIGLVGGVASGKSSIASMLKTCVKAQGGIASVLDADAIGHRVLTEPSVISVAVQRWGQDVLTMDGALDRHQIAELVFNSAAEREFWQQVTHPRIERIIRDELQRIGSLNVPPAAIILDAALLFEAHWERYCDHIIFVDAPENLRKKRAQERGWTEAEFEARELAQLPIAQKRARAQIVIDNSGTIEQTYKRVLEVWNSFSN